MATNNPVILHGGGGHARVVIDCLKAMGATILGFFDPKGTGEIMGIKALGEYKSDIESHAQVIVAIGDNAVRKNIAVNTKHAFAKAIHPGVILSEFSNVGEGSMLLHGVIVQPQTVIGKHVIVNTGAQVDHDCVVGDYAHIGPGSVLCGTVRVGEGTFIGAGTVIIPGRSIGKWAVVGAGSVVIHDIPDYAVAVGNPARVIRINKP